MFTGLLACLRETQRTVGRKEAFRIKAVSSCQLILLLLNSVKSRLCTSSRYVETPAPGSPGPGSWPGARSGSAWRTLLVETSARWRLLARAEEVAEALETLL